MPFFLKMRKRLVFVALFLFTLFSLLVVQFFKIQIIEGEKWALQARRQHQFVITQPFQRGLFYSNTSLKLGHPETPQAFVIDVPKFHLYADPKAIPSVCHAPLVEHLARVLSLKPSEKEHLRVQLEKNSRSRKLALRLDRSQHDAINSWWYPFAKQHKLPRNALFFIQDYQRSYPFGKLLGQVLHTVRDEKDEKTHQAVPTGGLELIFDRVLQGKEGKKRLLRSTRHSMETGEVLYPPQDGADVYLTINHYLQAMAEEEIAKAVKAANAKGGWAILMEPRTGEIWALAQYPYFEPAHYRSYFNDPIKKEDTKVKAITDPYEPGSTMKPITIAIALKANEELKKQGKPPLFLREEKIATANGSFPGRSKPIKDVGFHHYLNMDLAIQKSSNIYMARLAQRIVDTLGAQWYRNALQEIFGFGVKTGVELPSESAGRVPMPGKLHQNGKPEWSVPTPFSLAFGHNILVNSMQMLKSYAVLANGGFDVTPTLVRKVERALPDGNTEILLDHTIPDSLLKQRRVLEPEIVAQVIETMKLVTKQGGSAPRADIYGYTEAGKTGTTEKIVNGTYSKKDHISTFIGFAPAKDPRFVLLIAIDEPEFKYIPGVGRNQFGGKCSAPAFAEIGLRTLQYLGVEPDDPYGYPVGDPRRDEARADMTLERRRLKTLYEQWNKK